MAGSLEGLEISPPRNLKVVPYVLTQISEDAQANTDADLDGTAGVDLKYSLTPSMTLDLSYNTDFAQVEVDEQQVNLDRFNLFFPEKRPFFLENAGLFSVGAPGEVELFFSRRIGIGPNGVQIPILGGGRVSGKVGNTNIGLLNMQTESVDGLVSANNYSVARIQQEFGNRSALGIMFNNRTATGDLAGDDDYNRAFALDGRIGIGQYGQISGFVSKTSTPGVSTDDHAYQLFSRYTSDKWMLQTGFTEVASNFNPELGFLGREGFRKFEALIFRTSRRIQALGLHELRPHTSYRSYWDFEGRQQTGFWHIDNHWEFKNGYEVHTGVNITHEGVFTPFEISPGVTVPVDSYDHAEAQIVFNSNLGAPVSVSLREVFGGFFGGRRVAHTITLMARAGDRLTTETAYRRNNISLPGGDFDTNLLSSRISYAFTPRLFLQGLFQYNDRVDLTSANFRIGWLQAANSGLFVVFNQTRLGGDLANQSVILKYSRVFDVLR